MSMEDIMQNAVKVENPDLLVKNERRVSWQDVPELFEPFIIETFAKSLKADNGLVLRIFNLACPHVIIGLSYWRIAPCDGVLLKRLLAYYIKSN